MSNTQTRIIYLIAGEPSGDLLGARLMRELKEKAPFTLLFAGIGGEKMKAEGLTSLFPYQDLSLFGMVELIPHIYKLLARIDQTVLDIETKAPVAVITIDVPGFSRRVVRKLREKHHDSFYVHYVAPSVWAWRPNRVETYAKLFDHLLCLLPFEPPLFERAGLAATFVGHTVVTESKTGNARAFRERFQLLADTPLFCVLPGSRPGEIAKHMLIFARTITLLAARYPNLAIVLPVPKHLLEVVRPYFENCPYRAIVTANEADKYDGIAASNLAIVKSGTVALEVAAAKTPMVIAYKVNPITAFFYRRLRLTPLVSLINILLGREVIPELLQEDCTPNMIASASESILSSPERIKAQQEAMGEALAMLKSPAGQPPSGIAADVILERIH